MTVDPDAEAAHQLTRALTMTRAGRPCHSAAQDLRAEEWNQEWEDILADSVKRKRRKKMKKHKLRKLRKLTLKSHFSFTLHSIPEADERKSTCVDSIWRNILRRKKNVSARLSPNLVR
ncbi:hypothetical protein K438DRAFT_1928258 [Mycena galopus ATCC 62051]|nr:hypothetical protein K438DRAFT_1928258 [Mycena galopus ATCC 62051]